jgi:hypothetical protein
MKTIVALVIVILAAVVLIPASTYTVPEGTAGGDYAVWESGPSPD